jgi:ammonia channel protein AmtB
MNQLIAVALTILLSVVATVIILKVVDLLIGLRVSEEDELRGLDLSQHSEEAYNMDVEIMSLGSSAHETVQNRTAAAGGLVTE